MPEGYSDSTYPDSEPQVARNVVVAAVPKLHHSEEFKNIYAALIKAQAEFTPVPKNKTATIRNPKTNGTYTYKYADLADVLAMALPVLTKHDLGLLQPHLRAGVRLRVCTLIIHTSGEWLMSDGINLIEGGSPQDFGGDSSYYRRYDACSLLGIVADEDVDAQKGAETGKAQTVRQPERTVAARPGPKEPQRQATEPRSESRPTTTPGEDLLLARDVLVAKLFDLVPDKKTLGHKAKVMFPEHQSTKTLTVADLQRLYDALAKEKAEAEKPAPSAKRPVGPKPPDIPADVAAMLDEGTITTAGQIQTKTIGKGLAQRLHKLIGIHKIHTEAELLEQILRPLSIEHASDLPVDMYEWVCDWAEGKEKDPGSIGDEE